MQDYMHIVRNMAANREMIEVYDKTRKLYDTFGFDGAQAYLSWQMYLLQQMHEDNEPIEKDFGGDENAI